MKKIFYGIIALLVVLPLTAFAKDKVKVYVFEAGGCPACEAQYHYLESLDGYNKTFEVIKKELYVDHVDWENGKDYDLGVKVADAFSAAGYDAAYNSTPLVIISDVYAANGYSESLESIINDVYEKGDKDAVTCIEKDGSDCISTTGGSAGTTESDNTTSDSSSSSNAGVIATTLISALVVIVVYLVKSYIDKKDILEAINKKK